MKNKNHSYVYIPADKLTELITGCCPPVHNPLCPGNYEHDIDEDCAACWKSWLMDGEQS